MKQLFKLEQQFQDHLLHQSQDIVHHMVGTQKVPLDIRLSIYSNAYRLRLHEALMANYPILEGYLGGEPFEELSFAYIDAHPSLFRSIRWFGDQLPTFLSQQDPYNDYPYLAELARFEWTMASVFDAADGEVITIEAMQHIPPEAWETMQLQMHPSVRRLSLNWNAVQIWQMMSDDETPVEPIQTEAAVDWVVWRAQFMTHFSSLTPDEAWAIDAMQNQLTFGELCAGLCQWVSEQDAGVRAASLLKGWITSGFITNVKTHGKDKFL